ncbi:Os03g0829333 [Oryza sativa Japonica Group]|uniref:Os03g0829333 protein n=1 Tax=Oryza sativa subsp. japonica TaxID=39947 RepID=A0A0P0W542_ORYSJ|nr:hypothetical protein EE612_021443 [Oryza sativa]BAS87184.1 Os03g0829333 [Oryza sativa Japonica Group]
MSSSVSQAGSGSGGGGGDSSLSGLPALWTVKRLHSVRLMMCLACAGANSSSATPGSCKQQQLAAGIGPDYPVQLGLINGPPAQRG